MRNIILNYFKNKPTVGVFVITIGALLCFPYILSRGGGGEDLHRMTTMAADLLFSEEEMRIDEGLGYPKAYAKLCRDRGISPYSRGPPFTFTPYALQQHEILRAEEFEEMFPIMDPIAKPSAKPSMFVSLLWKQLNHLGNAGFDPAIFRVDPYGNVLYYHADSASPLGWDSDHWFPCSRGGLTSPSNLRIVQWQVCRKKHNKLEFLIPWWDLQVGISINQFLSIFASSNSDFRRRAFSLLFSEGESEELNASETVDSHVFPQHFIELKEKLGLAPAGIVLSRRESYDTSSILKSLDMNRRPRSSTPIIAARILKSSISKENMNPDMGTNPYQAIVMARDSLRHTEETAKMQAEIQKLDDEVNELKQKAEEEKVAIQELELVLIKRRRRAEKCRRLAEAQSSYRTMLEKMIRDSMHQSVIYKEQVRLNQAATNALMARLEAQKAICDTSEKELHRKFKQKDKLEKQVRPEGEHARKRSRMDNLVFEENDDGNIFHFPENKQGVHLEKEIDDALLEKGENGTLLCLPGVESSNTVHKELRVFLAEEDKASEAGLYLTEERKKEGIEEDETEIINNIISKGNFEDGNRMEDKHQAPKVAEKGEICNIQFPDPREPSEKKEDEERIKQRGKGNLEKWLQMLLENAPDGSADTNSQNGDNDNASNKTDEIIRKLNLKYPQQKNKVLGFQESQDMGDLAVGGLVVLKHVDEENSQKRVQKNDRGQKSEEDRSTSINKSPPYKLEIDKTKADEVEAMVRKGVERRSSLDGHERNGKEKGLVRSGSARAFHRIPSSPSLIMGMKKGVDCIRRKPLVIGDDDSDENGAERAGSNFIKSSIKSISRAMKL